MHIRKTIKTLLEKLLELANNEEFEREYKKKPIVPIKCMNAKLIIEAVKQLETTKERELVSHQKLEKIYPKSSYFFFNSVNEKICNEILNFDLRNKKGETALICAASNGYTELVSILIDAKATIDIQDYSGTTALSKAVQHNHSEVVAELVEKKASLNIQDNDGKNALMDAVSLGQLNNVEQLIKAGANIQLIDKSGRTALDILIYRQCSQNSLPIVNFLMTRGGIFRDLKTLDQFISICNFNDPLINKIISLYFKVNDQCLENTTMLPKVLRNIIEDYDEGLSRLSIFNKNKKATINNSVSQTIINYFRR